MGRLWSDLGPIKIALQEALFSIYIAMCLKKHSWKISTGNLEHLRVFSTLPFFVWIWISFWWIYIIQYIFEVNKYLKAHGTGCWIVGRWARWSGANGQDRHKAQGLGARLLNIDCTQSSTDSWRATMKIEAHCKIMLQNFGNGKGSGTQFKTSNNAIDIFYK